MQLGDVTKIHEDEKANKDKAYLEIKFNFHGGKHFWRWIGIATLVLCFVLMFIGRIIFWIVIGERSSNIRTYDQCMKAGYGAIGSSLDSTCVTRHDGWFKIDGTSEKYAKSE